MGQQRVSRGGRRGNDPRYLLGALIRAREARENFENFEELQRIFLEFVVYRAGTLRTRHELGMNQA